MQKHFIHKYKKIKYTNVVLISVFHKCTDKHDIGTTYGNLDVKILQDCIYLLVVIQDQFQVKKQQIKLYFFQKRNQELNLKHRIPHYRDS